MNRLLALLCVCCFALGLVAVGCGGDDDDSGSNNGGGSAADTSGGGATTEKPSADKGAGGAGGATAAVTMKDIQFDPPSVTVAKGGEVTWTNDDSVGHDVTSDDGSFKSGSAGGLSQGDTFKYTFKQAGNFKYVCSVHPGMEGTVTVK